MENKSNLEKMGLNNSLKNFSNKKVLITGHTGFKGSWLSIWLTKLGAKVVGYSLPPKTPNDNYCTTKLKEHVKEYIADIRDKEKLFNVINKEKPEVIFHLAAQPLVIESYLNPLYTIETNTIGTANILEAFRIFDYSQVLIIVTTDKVYENFESKNGYKENDRLGGNDIYSASKATAEILTNAYIKSFISNEKNKSIVSVRAGNVIGGGDCSRNRIVPDCIRAFEKNEPVLLRNPKSIRPWQFVLEPLYGYLILANKLMSGKKNLIGAWNFGPERKNHTTVEVLVKKIIKYYGKGDFIVDNNTESFKETNNLVLNINKAKSILNWKPKYNLNQSIHNTVEWYLNYKEVNMFDFCLKQIENYEHY